MKICIACQANVEGKQAVPIKEDRIIRVIRAIKRLFGVAQMNELYVCQTDLPKHAERRRSFERTMLFASIFAGIMVLLIIYSFISALLGSGRFDLWAPVSAVVVAFFLLSLPLFRYTPAIETPKVPIVMSQTPKPPPPSPQPEPEPEEPEERPERQMKKTVSKAKKRK